MDFETGEYILLSPQAEKVQENFLYNDHYFSCVFQTGNGYSTYVHPSGIYNQIIEGTPYYGHLHFYAHNRVVYVRDDASGEFWSVGWYPVCAPRESYECRHGAGYSIFRNRTDGIDASWRIFVPRGEDPVELWTLQFANRSRRVRRLSVFSVAELSLKTEFPLYGHEIYMRGLHLPGGNGVGTRKIAMNLPHPYFGAVLLSSRKPVSWDTDKAAFLGGEFESPAKPAAVRRGRCSGSLSSRALVLGALHHRLTVRPGQTARLDLLAGACKVDRIPAEAARYRRKYLAGNGAAADRAFAAMRKDVEKRLARMQMQTPDRKFNYVFNRWVPRLIELGATLGRWGFFGFRDLVQQNQGALTLGDSPKRRQRLEMAMSHQWPTGYGVRSFPALHEDSTMKYADSALWLVSAVTEYLKETGDMAFLNHRLPYLGGGEGTVFQHLLRAMEALSSGTGRHGLCLIHEGDWCDSMTHVGRKGRGESVWLSEAYCYACLCMEELCLQTERKARAAVYRRKYRKMKDTINRNAWDGKWYRRAYDDDGRPLGSKSCKQGQIFANAQSWAMISRIVPPKRLRSAMTAMKRRLRTPYGYTLFRPAYSYKQDSIGRLTCLEPGTADNATVYTHGNAFLTVGLLMQGQADEAWDVLSGIMPYNPNNPSRARIEYQVSNGYFGLDYGPEPGRAEHGWMTGSASWLYLAATDFLFGLRRTYEGLRLRPQLPTGWKKASLRREFRGTVYELTYRRSGKGSGNRIVRLTVNGKAQDPEIALPLAAGKTLRVEARLA